VKLVSNLYSEEMEMSKGNTTLTLIQILLGSVFGLAGAGLSLLIFDKLLWKGLLYKAPPSTPVISGGILLGIPLLITILLTYGITVLCVGEGVRLAAYWIEKKNLQRNNVYQGAFLGAPAAAALMTMATYDWSGMGMDFNPMIMGIIRIIAVVISFPVKILLLLRCPPELLLIIAAPIGAILGYRLSKPDELEEDNDTVLA